MEDVMAQGFMYGKRKTRSMFSGEGMREPARPSRWTLVVAVRLCEVCGIERCGEGGR
jgi:hypothetical protein